MSKVRLLLLSSFASGFGFCSIILAMFTMISALSFPSFFTFVLTLVFFGINMVFTLHYYTSITKQLSVKDKRKARI
ncbi:MAG: hypothetical protein EAZ60_28395 [Oscillatoriales cyanobacterium]|nr:MAG: hypothetical protein EAZ83_25390 [Oscillatoriales cyanobacterium]TAE93820.1 MAG: hypothetical protein EAZ79_25890 [Oscillatoriales cyanobacterium]TAF17887.1 MAG: hypothetical protein EAZ73_19560 [Oscillatoriales cyanobacterium]TAF35554.1 MAG: hypothetical protein EAZ69_12985 [Oscillatoriales cyanobacterium]TAF50636.1 MAG: hypothetical protein EAZ60_28395 [Oscillatoriales cyanobacterium]